MSILGMAHMYVPAEQTKLSVKAKIAGHSIFA